MDDYLYIYIYIYLKKKNIYNLIWEGNPMKWGGGEAVAVVAMMSRRNALSFISRPQLRRVGLTSALSVSRVANSVARLSEAPEEQNGRRL